MQKYNIQLDLTEKEFKRLMYVFTKNGMDDTTSNYYGDREEKIRVTKQVDEKLDNLYRKVIEADNDSRRLSVYEYKYSDGFVELRTERDEYDSIEINSKRIEYKNFK